MRLTKLVRIGRIYAAISDEVTVSDRGSAPRGFHNKPRGSELSVGRRMSSMENLNMRIKAAKSEQGKNTVAATMVEMTISKVIVGVLLMLFVMSMIENMKTDASAEEVRGRGSEGERDLLLNDYFHTCISSLNLHPLSNANLLSLSLAVPSSDIPRQRHAQRF
jgi:hypothetical protein